KEPANIKRAPRTNKALVRISINDNTLHHKFGDDDAHHIREERDHDRQVKMDQIFGLDRHDADQSDEVAGKSVKGHRPIQHGGAYQNPVGGEQHGDSQEPVCDVHRPLEHQRSTSRRSFSKTSFECRTEDKSSRSKQRIKISSRSWLISTGTAPGVSVSIKVSAVMDASLLTLRGMATMPGRTLGRKERAMRAT